MNSRILALDIGEKRVGLAISDPLGIIAQPYMTLNWKGIEKWRDFVEVLFPPGKVLIEFIVGNDIDDIDLFQGKKAQ